ncbi:receptor-like protein kinase 5 [Impatiens glandulifera]|uniref:receptor-like protein kinase 5 n=1 Tax=Impatiens glandulifera TaxID=253017 RepID=UPI001FB0B66E|nr:receptor-like protein kinase 5 [Impatiens glandulifera]
MAKKSFSPAPSSLSILSLFLLPCIFLPFLANSQLPNEEEAILLNIKKIWSNPPVLSHWVPSSSNSTHCNWPEIICSNGYVTGIQLIDLNLTEPIPPFICDLKNLTHIDFQLNYFSGPFPKAFYNCTNLQYLDLSQNTFTGPIPNDIDSLSKHLNFLNLLANNFIGDIPPAIGRFPELKSLNLIQNKFNGSFPSEIGDLLNLEFLELSFNNFTPSEIPKRFTQLQKLKIFSIRSSNLIGEIPVQIGNMTDLVVLDLNSNALTGEIPKGLLLLKNLTTIWLYKNRLSGPIPRPIESMNLEIIDLSENFFMNGTIPFEFGNLENLKELSLFDNQFSGGLPENLGRLTGFQILRLWNNSFEGTIPQDLGRYSNITDFQVSSNKFTGFLPDGLCERGVLKGLIAFDNNFTGELPKSIGNCPALKTVQVQGNNHLTGEIPIGLWTSFNLSVLILNDNSFTGELPDTIAMNLSRIELSNNKFSGEIPNSVSSWIRLTVFNASNNLFTGGIPQGLTSLPSITTILLDNNRLSGNLPFDIISWKVLNMLNLRGNQLSGEIPPKFGSLPSLTDLDLSNNQFSGEIPPEFNDLKLNVLNLSNNKFWGKIPSVFENGGYNYSFLDNSGLCANNPSVGINLCSELTKNSRRKSKSWFVVMAVVLAVLFIVSGLLLSLFAVGYYKKRKLEMNSKWKLTSFQRLEFTEMNILPGLTEKNLIGSGGSGKVYRVPINRSSGSVQFVAVKKISNKQNLDERTDKEFQAEVKILSTIRHSNIVKLMCCVSSDKSKLLVYEFLDNRSLDRWLHTRKDNCVQPCDLGSVHQFTLDWPKRLRIAIGAARGLSYMHHDCTPAVIHRDVKSSNILLDSYFNAKVADFGLAKILLNPGEANTMSVIAGSIGYMSPEYAQTTRVNEKIDVYSFGVVLLELVTGKQAHLGGENTSLAEWALIQIQEKKPIVEALDMDAMEPCYLNEMTRVFELGVYCTSAQPLTRPSMKEVLEILLRCGQQHQAKDGDSNMSPEASGVPLLKNSRRERKEEDVLVDLV